MPRRTYDYRAGRRRPSVGHGPAFVRLVREMGTPQAPRPCATCGEPMPTGWRRPTHAACTSTKGNPA